MSELTIELPNDDRAELSRRAGSNPSAESTRVADAVRERLAACAEMDYLRERAARGRREAFERVLAKVPTAKPVSGDEW